MKKKIISIVLIVLAVLVILSLFGAGYFGFGPLSFIGDNRMKKLPGNQPEYYVETVVQMENSPLSGKTVAFLGSSVTYGSASVKNSMAEYLGVRFGFTPVKEAVSGTTLVDNGNSSYVSRMKKMDKEAEYSLFIVQLSTNDATKKKPLGEISTSFNLDDFDTETIAGAIEYIIVYAKETWNCPVMFYTGSKYDDDNYSKMVDLLFDIAEKHDIGVIDLWTSESFNNITDEQRELYMDDNIHPYMAGYKEWWTPEMEKQVLDFLTK